MHSNIDDKKVLIGRFKNVRESEEGEALVSSLPSSPSQGCTRPTSMVIKKAHTLIPAHLVAEAIWTLHGSLDLRWSGPITPSEMQYVQQYVFAKYPEYSNGLVRGNDEQMDLYAFCDQPSTSTSTTRDPSHLPCNNNNNNNNSSNNHVMRIQLEPSRLSGIILAKKTPFVSIPEIQVRNRALQSCGLTERDYSVVFSHNAAESMVMVGESYPFFKGSYYLTVLASEDECDPIRAFATSKEAKVVAAPESWLDLRIKGSQLSQYFRKKSKYSPKGLFAYSAVMNNGGARSSMHWISEAHRNLWHVLMDASGLDLGMDRRALALHRPDFVVCAVDDSVGSSHQPLNKITCLLVRKESFQSAPVSAE